MSGRFEFGHRVNLKHGHTSKIHISKTYRVWDSMKARCSNPAHPAYADYGGRGIAVCERWQEFANFLADMGGAPAGRSLERENNSKGYAKGNCKWATLVEQNQNKRSNVNLTYNGETHCIAEWARRAGVTRQALRYRLAHKWPLERTFARKQ